MATKSVLWTRSARLDGGLSKLHGVIRSGSEDAAVALYLKLIGNLFEAEFARQKIRREAEFLRVVDASKAIGPEGSGRNITPRQALIAAALGGWFGDDPSDWISPISQSEFLSFAESYYQGPNMDIEVAFRGLLAEGLFFEVHPGVFAEPCYFCSYDSEFLDELPEANRHAKSWRKFRKYHDRASRGWEQAGLCWGQGREGGLSDGETGLCLGTSCCCFAQHPEKACTHELRYAPHLLTLRGKPIAKS